MDDISKLCGGIIVFSIAVIYGSACLFSPFGIVYLVFFK